jgi:hypothetical protein
MANADRSCNVKHQDDQETTQHNRRPHHTPPNAPNNLWSGPLRKLSRSSGTAEGIYYLDLK